MPGANMTTTDQNLEKEFNSSVNNVVEPDKKL